MDKLTAIRNNRKTILSFDTHSNCKRNCPYCYVRAGQRRGGFTAVKKVSQYTYDHDLLRMKGRKQVKAIQKTGLRLFSFADYRKKDQNMVKNVLGDCRELGLTAKAITKSFEFVRDFGDHPVIEIINLSVDSLMTQRELNLRESYQSKYDKVLLRCVILQDWDVPKFLDMNVDIFTFNHGINGYFNYGSYKSHRNRVINYYGIRNETCGLTNTCLDCELQCGRYLL